MIEQFCVGAGPVSHRAYQQDVANTHSSSTSELRGRGSRGKTFTPENREPRCVAGLWEGMAVRRFRRIALQLCQVGSASLARRLGAFSQKRSRFVFEETTATIAPDQAAIAEQEVRCMRSLARCAYDRRLFWKSCVSPGRLLVVVSVWRLAFGCCLGSAWQGERLDGGDRGASGGPTSPSGFAGCLKASPAPEPGFSPLLSNIVVFYKLRLVAKRN